jgi:hypothetical protein
VDRGPVALFGAIVAVGLGPALWLGAQFGSATVVPDRPATVVDANQNTKAPGRAGAAPDDQQQESAPKPRSQYVPLSGTPSVRPSASASSPAESDGEPVTDPATTEPTSSQKPSTPPTESTTDPAGDPPTGDPGTGLPTGEPEPPQPDEPGPGQPDGTPNV